MATERRRRSNPQTMRRYIIVMFLVPLFIGGVGGFCAGRCLAPIKTVPTQKIIEVQSIEPTVETTEDVYLYDVPLSESLQRYIYDICEEADVPVPLVIAMIEHESGFDANAVSDTSDYGLMQINAINLEWLEDAYGCDDMTNPYQNVYCGVQIIGDNLRKFDGDINKALMAYNMGEYGARTAWNGGVTSTDYSESIIELMTEYEQEAADAE